MQHWPKKPLNWVKYLNMEDLYLLRAAGHKMRSMQIAQYLGLSPPAICQRIKRYEETLGQTLIIPVRNKDPIITDFGKEVIAKADLALDIIETMRESSNAK